MPRPADMPTLRGLPNPNTTPLPNCIVDEYLPFFTGAELKVILYLVRRTLGFHKTRDAISLNQICNGIVRKDGRRLDRGTGLHKSTACDALNALAGWGMIKRMPRRDPARGDLPTEYILWIEGELEEEAVEARAGENGSGAPSTPGPVASAAERQARTGTPQRETTPPPLSAPPDRGGKTIHPVSGQAATPLSVRRDTPVSGQTDRQNPASREQYEQDHSNTRHTHRALAEGERRGRSSSTTDAVIGRLPRGDRTPQTSTPSRGGGTRDDCLPSASPIGATAAGDPTRETLHHFAEVVAREFNDRAPLRATLSRLVNLYHRADLPTDAFAERFDGARQRTKERTAAIRPPLRGAANERAAKNKMPYFFALLEESLGLREEIALPATAAAHDAPAVRDIPPAVIPGVPPAGETSEVARPGDTPSRHLSPATAPTDAPPPPMTDTDAQIIGAVVREFSRQFAEYATAVALADWAVALWRDSGLSRRHFLELAGAASEEMVRETSEAASAPLFRTRLAATLGQSSDAEGASMPSAPGYRSSSVLPGTDVGRHEG